MKKGFFLLLFVLALTLTSCGKEVKTEETNVNDTITVPTDSIKADTIHLPNVTVVTPAVTT